MSALRALRSILADHWREPAYSGFQFVHYEPEPKEPSFMQMVVDQRDGSQYGARLFGRSAP